MTKDNNIVKVEEMPGSKILLDIRVLPEDMSKFQKDALKKLGEGMAVGGFRQGKAPLDILKDQVDKDKWLLEAVDLAVTEKYYEAVMQYNDKYITIASPRIEFTGKLDHTSLENGFEFKAEVDIYPRIELPDYKDIKVDKISAKVDEKDVKSAIDDLLEKRSTLNDTLEGHEVKEGEWLDIDFDVFVDGEEMKDAGVKHFPLIIGKNSLIPGFEENLLGMKSKGKKSFKLKIDDNFRDKRLAGREAEFKVTVHEVKTIGKPEYNDDFVKGLHIKNVSTVKELDDFVKGNLIKEKEVRNKEEERNQILEKISEQTKVDIPESLISQELQLMWGELERNLAQRGMKLEEYLEKEKMAKDKVEEGWRDQAVKRVQISLIIREIIKQEEIKIEQKEIDEYIKNELVRIKDSLSKGEAKGNQDLYHKYEQEYKKDENKARVEQQMILDKMFEILSSYMVK